MITTGDIISREKRGLSLLVLVGFGQAGANVLTAVYVQKIFDSILIAKDPEASQNLLLYTGILALGALIAGLLIMWERVGSEKLGQSIVHRLRMRLFRHLTRVNPRVLEQRTKGGMNLRMVNDLTAIRQWISFGVARICVSGIAVLGTVSALFVLNPALAGLLLGFVITGTGLAIAIGRPLEHRVANARRRRAYLANNMGEKLTAMKTVQAFGRERAEAKRVRRQSRNLVNAMIDRSRMIGMLRGLMTTLTGLASMAVLAIGAYLVVNDATTPGTIAAAMAIVGFLVPPLRDFGRVYEYWIGFKVSASKIENTLALEAARTSGRRRKTLPEITGQIEFRNVALSEAVDSFSAKAEAGQKIAITGFAGAGKSTLLGLLAGLVQVDSGRVRVDSKRLDRLDIGSLRQEVGIVCDAVPLLRASIKANITYRAKNASTDEVRAAIEMTGVADVLDRLSDGLETKLVERGGNLSSGEQFRVKLARAILGMPAILLIDDADQNLDADLKRTLANLMDGYEGTLLIVTSDPVLVRHADAVWCVGAPDTNTDTGQDTDDNVSVLTPAT